jgi:photosystem II stability/assembly factor-like uncharacterized protein
VAFFHSVFHEISMSNNPRIALTSCFLLAATLIAPTCAWSLDTLKFDPLSMPATHSINVNRQLMNAVALAGDKVVASGERGLVMLSDDRGDSWHQAKFLPVSVTLNRIFFLNEKSGWAVGHGGIVLGTKDGGENWTLLFDGVRAAHLENQAAQADIGNSRRQTNAQRMVKEGADKPLFDIHFSDELNGMVIGAYGMLFVTKDGGKNWVSGMDRLGSGGERHLYSLQKLGQTLYITGEQGLLYKSTDDGFKFKAIETPAKGSIFGLLSTQTGYLIAYGLRGAIYRLEPNGHKWTRIKAPTITFTAGLKLTDGTLLLANEAGQIVRSLDNGATYEEVHQAEVSPLVAMKEVSEGRLVLAGIRNLRVLTIENKKNGEK